MINRIQSNTLDPTPLAGNRIYMNCNPLCFYSYFLIDTLRPPLSCRKDFSLTLMLINISRPTFVDLVDSSSDPQLGQVLCLMHCCTCRAHVPEARVGRIRDLIVQHACNHLEHLQ